MLKITVDYLPVSYLSQERYSLQSRYRSNKTESAKIVGIIDPLCSITGENDGIGALLLIPARIFTVTTVVLFRYLIVLSQRFRYNQVVS